MDYFYLTVMQARKMNYLVEAKHFTVASYLAGICWPPELYHLVVWASNQAGRPPPPRDLITDADKTKRNKKLYENLQKP